MKRQEIEQNLSKVPKWSLKVPTGHRQQLRLALLEYGSKHRSSFWSWVRQNIKNMQTNFKPASFVAGAMVAVLVLAGVQAANNSPILAKYNPFATQSAQAKAAVRDIMFKAKQLTPEQRENIEKKMKADMESSLAEAYAAKDLEIITGDAAKQFGFGSKDEGSPKALSFGVMGKAEGQTAPTDIKGGNGAFTIANPMQDIVKQLRYTDPEGRKVVLGIDKDGLPTMKLMTLSEGEMINIQQKLQKYEGADPATTGEFNVAVPSGSAMPAAGFQVQVDDEK